MELNLPKLPKLTLSKLQALLLLGGAFVFATALVLGLRYRLALDTTPTVPARAVVALSILKKDPSFFAGQPWQRFLASLPAPAAQALTQATPGQSMTLFAVPDENGGLQWSLVEALSSDSRTGAPRWRLVSRAIDAVGFVDFSSARQPFSLRFGLKNLEAEVGQTYRGITPEAPSFSAGRRLVSPIKEQALHLEKPYGVSWNGIPSLLQDRLQRYGVLAEPWTWPGRVELTVSASATEASLQPFLLYYIPQGGRDAMTEKIDIFAKKLLSEASPLAVKVRLPDSTSMTELRNEIREVVETSSENRFGRLLKYSTPGTDMRIAVFHAKTGESWISTEVGFIQAGLVDSLGAEKPSENCNQGGNLGFASFSGAMLPMLGTFSSVNITLRNLETGMFTICGYYRS